MGAKQFAWDLSTDDEVCYTLQIEHREPASLRLVDLPHGNQLKHTEFRLKCLDNVPEWEGIRFILPK